MPHSKKRRGMLIQFSNIDYQDLELAKFSAWLIEHDDEPVPSDLAELSKSSRVAEEALRDNLKIKDLLADTKKSTPDKIFRTPLSDWHEQPFLIDRNERPVSAANAWLRYISKRGSPKTWRTYAYALFDYFQYLEANNIDWM